jgi:alpha-methylacyl-CoA racemase
VTSLPLSGVRIIELAGIGPAPYGVMLLADLGADVIRIDRAGDQSELSAWTLTLSRGRRSIALDLKRPEAVDVLLDLVRTSDVLVESYRPGVAERLGFGPDVCSAINPSLIYVRVTGWGQAGPLAMTPGHDINYLALSGGLYNLGRSDSPPTPPQAYMGDFGGGGTFLVIGVLAALFERTRSGKGQVIDAAVLDGATSLTSVSHGLALLGLWGEGRGATPGDGSVPYYDTYRTLDHEFIAVGALEHKFYAVLLSRLNLSPSDYPQHERSRWPALRDALTNAFAAKTRDEWEQVFAGHEACVTPVLRLHEAADHAHNVTRAAFVNVDGHLLPNVAPRLSRTPGRAGSPPPLPGADSVDILSEMAYSPEVIEHLLGSGAIAQGGRRRHPEQTPDDDAHRARE